LTTETQVEKKTPPSLLLVLAVLCEVLAVVLAFAPAGSWGAPGGAREHLVPALVLCGALVAATAALRAAVPGAGVGALFVRTGGSSAGRTIYYGFAAAVILAFYRAAWAVALHFAGTSFDVTLPREVVTHGPFPMFAYILASLAAAYLYFGYVQGAVGETLGRRTGVLAAAALAAVAAVWPATGPSAQVGAYAPRLVFLAWRLPEALALAWLAERTRTVFAPLITVFLLAWITAVGTGVYALFGPWAFLLACVFVTLIAIRVVAGEARRLGRAGGGFVAMLFGYDDATSLADSLLFTAALAGVLVVVRATGFITWNRYVSAGAIVAVLTGAVVLAIIGRRRKPSAAPPPAEVAADDAGR